MRYGWGLFASALLITGCAAESGPEPASDSAHHADHSTGDHAELSEAQRAYAEVNSRMHAAMAEISEDPDTAFMQGMLAHHRGAVEMSEVALEYGTDEQVRDLAQRIIDAQQAEIDEMEQWLAARSPE